jgi:hypothetical protein
MKKGFQMAVAIFFCAFIAISCNKTDAPAPAPDHCGAAQNTSVSMNKNVQFVFSESEWTENNVLVQTNKYHRIFMLKQSGTGICPDESVTLEYKILTGNAFQTTVPVQIDGTASWNGDGSKILTLATENDGNMKTDFLYQGYLTTDLKPAFGTSAASMQSVLTISYYSLGNMTLDTAYFKAMFKEVSLDMNCKSYKD